ncbi:MAG: glycosyltransferase family 1 protein, partial [Candidatus Paceibacterota bacterium]
KVPGVPSSFSLYYYLFLPVKLYFEKLDLVFFPNYMLPIIFRGKSLVVLTEDIFYEFKSGSLPFRYKLAYKIFSTWAAKHANKIMAVSESSKKNVAELFHIPENKVVVNQHGIERPANRPSADKENHVLYVGQAFPRRHLKETMLAFEKISSQFTNLNLVAVGKDKYNPPIIKELKEDINKRLGREAIIYKDYIPQEELENLYAKAKLIIYVSSKEAFGLPPIEALAYGTPAVVAKESITKEIFGDSAFFVEKPDDINSIAGTLSEALNDENKRKEIVNSAEEILGRYTWQKHTDRFINICRNISQN